MRLTFSIPLLFCAAVAVAQESPSLTPEALRKRAQSRAKAEPQKALTDLDQVLKLKPDWAEAFLDRARLRQRLGDAKGALADCDAALTKISGWYDALELRGHLKRSLGDRAGAVADWTAAAKAPGNWGGAQFNLGTVKLELRDAKGALAQFDAAIKLSPKYAEAYLNRGFAKHMLGDLPGAIADCDAGIKLRPAWGEAYFNRGVFKAAARDLKGAVVDFTLTLKHRPNHRDARINRARAQQEVGLHPAALQDFDRVLKAADDPELRYYRARSRWALKQTKGALADAAHAAKKRAKWAPPLVLLAEIQLDQGKTMDAIANLTLALTLDPKNPNLYLARANAQGRQGSLKEAIKDCGAALALQPQSSGAFLQRALFHGRLGDTKSAVSDMLRFARLDGSVYGPLWVAGWTGNTSALQPFAAAKGWAGALARFGLGQLDADGLLKAAAAAPTERKRRERLCEANGYLGLFAERAGKSAVARLHYRECWKQRVPDFVEAEWARARLKALGD